MVKRIAVGQAGGPTAVINASLVGLLNSLDSDAELFAVRDGYQGLAENDFVPIDEQYLQWIKKHRFVPGACLGSGRYKFTEDRIHQAVHYLKHNKIDVLVFIGGNGTMAALQRISEKAREIHHHLQVIGIPKTVDNDLAGTDHAPGFGSAARYIAASTRDISKDLEAMKNFEQVRIIETMGRNAGWLAAASGFLRDSENAGPHFIYLPEEPFTKDQFLSQITQAVKEYGIASVVVSEGVSLNGNSQTLKEIVDDRTILGGISLQLESLVKNELNLNARAEILGMNQRSSSLAVSYQDQLEAYETGKKAAELIDNDHTNVMVTIKRTNDFPYEYKMESCSLECVTREGERLLPKEFIENRPLFYKWLKPLVGNDLELYPSALKTNMKTHKKVYPCQ